MYSKRVGLKTSFEVSIANLTSFKEGPGEIFSLEFWIHLFDLSVQCAIIDISDMSNTIGRNTQVNHSVLNDIEQYRRNRWYSNIVHIMRNHSGLTKTFLD